MDGAGDGDGSSCESDVQITDTGPSQQPSKYNDVSSDEDNRTTGRSCYGFPTSAIPALVCASLNRVLVAMAVTLMVPFFILEAEKRNAGEVTVRVSAEIGLVFSMSKIAEVLTVPFVTKDLPNIGSKFVVIISASCVGGAIFLFAFVKQIPQWKWFLGISYADRIIQGVATISFTIALFTYLVGQYPKAVGRINGILEAGTAMGGAVAPLVGGTLYDWGGFKLPFLVCGSVAVFTALSLIFVLPAEKILDPNSRTHHHREHVTTLSILKVPWVWVIGVNVFLGSVLLSSPEIAIPPFFARTFHTRSYVSGLSLALLGIVYSCVSPYVGYMLDRGASAPHLELVGFALSGVGCFVLGPARFLGMAPAIGFTFAGVVLTALGLGIIITTGAPHMITVLESRGLGSPQQVRFPVAGVVRLSASLGYGTGCTLANSLRTAVGFPTAMAILGVVCFIQGVVIALACLLSWLPSRQERQDTRWYEGTRDAVAVSLLHSFQT